MKLFVSLAGIIGVGLAASAPLILGGSATFDGISDVGGQLLLMLAGLSLVSSLAKAGKLQLLLIGLGQRLPFPRTLAISLATDFAFLSSPAGAAGYIVNVALLRKDGTPWTVATTVVGAEQTLDLLFFAVALPIATFSALEPLGHILPQLSGGLYFALLTAGLSCAYGLWRGRQYAFVTARNLVCAIPWLQARQARVVTFIAESRGQVCTLLKADAHQNMALMLLTTLQWLTRYGVLWAVLLEFGHSMPFGFVFALQAGVLHLAQWTGIPAGGGSADLALAAALTPWLTNTSMVTWLLLWRFATLYLPLLIGGVSLLGLTGQLEINRAEEITPRR